MFLTAITTAGGYASYNLIVNGESITLPLPMVHLGDEVYATPGVRPNPDAPRVELLFSAWSLKDMMTGRDIPMWYAGTDVHRMRRFVGDYIRAGRRLPEVELDLFCETWRANNGIGVAPVK